MAKPPAPADGGRSSGHQTTKPYCRNLPRSAPALPPAVTADPARAAAIVLGRSKWVNGTVLHYAFFSGSSRYSVPHGQADAVRDAFAKWKAIGIGLEFKEVPLLAQAEVRVGYSLVDGTSASGVGRDILNISLNEPTTVYGWDLTSPYGRGTALHELGHVLGMEHEHQNPYAGIKWHEQAVYDALAKPPNRWDRSTTYHNILEKLSPQQVQGSRWDPDSIMEYEFEPGLIDEPQEYDVNGLTPPGTLSADDMAWVRKWYPPVDHTLPLLAPFESRAVDLAAGEQVDFAVAPAVSQKYTIETKGATDTLLVLFEDVNGEPVYLSGDDDSGEERNAMITYRLLAGRRYIVRVRLYYPGRSGKTHLMIL